MDGDFRAREDKRKEEFKAIKQQLIDDLRAKEAELKEKLSDETLKKVGELETLLEKVKKEKDTELTKHQKIANIQSALLFKIFEKNKKLFLEILEDAKLSPDDLKKLMSGESDGRK